MADQFEQWLSASLAPDQRDPDRAFTALVQAQIALDRQLDEVARASRRRLALEVLAIGATAAGAAVLVNLPEFASAIGKAPDVAIAALLAGFAFLVLLLSRDVPERADLAH